MDFLRLAHNFSMQMMGGTVPFSTIELFIRFLEQVKDKKGSYEEIVYNYLSSNHNQIEWSGNDFFVLRKLLEYRDNHPEFKKFKIALLFICLNEPYWRYAKDAMEGAKKFLLPGHQVDQFFWTDMKEDFGATVFPTEPQPWPNPTLFRYNLFLQQEDKLKEYDYVFYCDIDMKFVNVVGDEILGNGLTAAQHPGYALAQKFWIPYDPNPESAAYIPRPGKLIMDNNTGMPKFVPLFYAGGFQGGKTEDFIKAMKVMRDTIEKDLSINYIALWNEQAHWNKYLFDNPPDVVLSPSYIYPDSLIKEYYEKIWGCEYTPRLITLTKPFSIKPLSEQERKSLMNN